MPVQPPPLHPVNTEFFGVAALSVTTVPTLYDAEQVLPHVIALSTEVTVPVPVPVLVIPRV
jgi:hypothetical protein